MGKRVEGETGGVRLNGSRHGRPSGLGGERVLAGLDKRCCIRRRNVQGLWRETLFPVWQGVQSMGGCSPHTEEANESRRFGMLQ